MSTYSAPRGPRRSQRRNAADGTNQGRAAEPVVAGPADEQPPLGFDAHELVADMWSALGRSVEGQLFSAADWERVRWELWFTDRAMTSGQVPSGHTWTAVQRGLAELLISPAAKRRAGIELKRAVDTDAEAADEQIVRYKQRLKPV
jgi:hypothetical protein